MYSIYCVLFILSSLEICNDAGYYGALFLISHLREINYYFYKGLTQGMHFKFNNFLMCFLGFVLYGCQHFGRQFKISKIQLIFYFLGQNLF